MFCVEKLQRSFYRAVICLFFVFATRQMLFALSVSVPDVTEQGSFITVYFHGEEELSKVSVKLLDKKGTLSQSIKAFALDKTGKNYAALIGIPVWVTPGNWQINLYAMEGQNSFQHSRVLVINKTNFKEYSINLDSKNADLISKPDPKKKEEARILTEILTNFNKDAVPYDKKFLVPNPSKRITSDFGEKRKWIYKTGGVFNEIHHGVDLGIPQGSPIKSPASGTVVFSDERILTGFTMVIENAPGVYTIFYHLSELLKKVGDVVEAGELVARSGNTGFSTGPHLHWEMRINTVPVNPFAATKKALLE